MAKPTILETASGVREPGVLFARQLVRVAAGARTFLTLRPSHPLQASHLCALEAHEAVDVVDIKAGIVAFLQPDETIHSTQFRSVFGEPALRVAEYAVWPSVGMIVNVHNRGDVPCDIHFELVGAPLTGHPSIPAT